MQIEIRL